MIQRKFGKALSLPSKKFSINDVETIVTKNGELSYPFDVPKIANDAKKNSLTLEEEEYQKNWNDIQKDAIERVLRLC